MYPTTRSDSMKKKVQKREAYSRSAKRSLDNEFEATTSEVQPGLKKYKTEFKLYDHSDLVPKQAFGSLDCGIYVMHYMDDIAYERYLPAPFGGAAAAAFKADLIKRFAKSSKCWRAAS